MQFNDYLPIGFEEESLKEKMKQLNIDMNRELYREICKEVDNIPIFLKDWWMDAVCGKDRWDAFIVGSGNSVQAIMPYYLHKDRRGFNSITNPILTQFQGIWYNYDNNQNHIKRLKYDKKVINKIIDELEELKVDRFDQSFNYMVTNLLPFRWRGFRQKVGYTYVIDMINDESMVYNNFENRIKSDIKKASNKVTIKTNCSIENVYKTVEKTFKRQNKVPAYSIDLLKRIDKACEVHNCRKIFYAVDCNERIHSVVYIVWDNESAYYLLGGSDPELRDSGANSLLIYKAIKYTSEHVARFDFEGSVIESVEHYFRGFGAVQKPYYSVSRTYSTKYKIIEALRYVLKNGEI